MNTRTFNWLMDGSAKDLETFKFNPNINNRKKIEFWIGKFNFEKRLIQNWISQMNEEEGESWKT